MRAVLIRSGVTLVGAAAVVFAGLSDGASTAEGTAGIVVLALFAVWWSGSFARRHAKAPERAWSLWMLWPSLAAVLSTLVARDAWPIGYVVALVCVAVPTIALHALLMGQRDRAGAAPTGGLAQLVAWAPVVSACATLSVLLVAGVVEFVR